MMPNAFATVGKNINDLELEMKNKGNELSILFVIIYNYVFI